MGASHFCDAIASRFFGTVFVLLEVLPSVRRHRLPPQESSSQDESEIERIGEKGRERQFLIVFVSNFLWLIREDDS
ncbi:hypothetical protein EV2_005324 [Malus domestica]